MLRDVKDSERLNAAVQRALAQGRRREASERVLPFENLAVTVLSKEYWPVSESEANAFQVPPFLQAALDAFSENYVALKRLRKLRLMANLGATALTLHFDNGAFQFKVAPIYAAIIALFHEQRQSLSGEFIAQQLDVPLAFLRRKISFWVVKGVLREERSSSKIVKGRRAAPVVYTCVDVYEPKGELIASETMVEEGSPDVGAQGATEEERKQWTAYVISVVKNVKEAKIGIVHQMMRQYYFRDAKGGPSMEDLRDITDSLVADGVLTLKDNAFVLTNN